jgi:hypothetical protein
MILRAQLLGAADSEPRKATIIINFVHKSKREATQKDLQLRIGTILADQPDIRFWFLKDNGQRDLQLIIAGPTSTSSTTPPTRSRARCGRFR